MKLSTLAVGAQGIILGFDKNDSLILRMMEMGLTVGTLVEIAHEAPFGGAIAVRCRGALIALRLQDAARVEVEAQKK